MEERRSGRDRRAGKDRRSGKDRRRDLKTSLEWPAEKERRTNLDRRIINRRGEGDRRKDDS